MNIPYKTRIINQKLDRKQYQADCVGVQDRLKRHAPKIKTKPQRMVLCGLKMYTLFIHLYTRIPWVLGSQVWIILHFISGQRKQQMLFSQHSPAFG